jgi:hypothetical protein
MVYVLEKVFRVIIFITGGVLALLLPPLVLIGVDLALQGLGFPAVATPIYYLSMAVGFLGFVGVFEKLVAIIYATIWDVLVH